MCAVFYGVIVPQIHTGKIVLAVIFSLALAVMAVFTIVSSYIDPSDPAMITYRNKREK